MIYLVWGNVAYEQSTLLRAFESKDDAEAFKLKCEKHDEKMPAFSDDCTKDQYAREQAAYDKWVTKHPTKHEYPRYDDYSISELTLTRSKQP